jgi:uncharacterized membrane protein
LFEFLFKYSRTAFEQGEFLFASGWPLALLVGLVVLGIVPIAYTLYRYHQGLGVARLVVLGTLQTLIWAIVLTLLWRPALVTEELRPQENSVAVLLDTSASMSYGDGPQSRLQRGIQALEDRTLPGLADRFRVDSYAFADQATKLESLDRVPAPGAKTDIGDALLTVLRGANTGALGAVILVSDGADNAGDLDAAKIAEIASYGVPIHTLGVGREQIPEDLELADVVVAPESLPGSTVSAQVSIRHGRGGTAQLKVYDGDAILASKSIELPAQAGVTTRSINLDVGSAGVRDLRFTVDPLPGEIDVTNNTQLRPMEVPPQRLDILYIEGEPRWEYKFIRRAIGKDSPLRLAGLLRTTPNKYYRQGLLTQDELEDGFPTETRDLFAYDALIIGSFEAAALTPEQQDMIRDFVSRRGGSLLMLGGRRGLADGGWGATSVAEVLPAQLEAEPQGPTFDREPAKAVLTEDGARSEITRLGDDDEANEAAWSELPELADFQHIGELKPGAVALLDAQFQGKTEPLLVEQQFGRGHAYILATGGTWRWQMQLPHEDQRHETFWRQLLQALAATAPRPVTLSSERVFYGDQRSIELRAEIKDPEFAPAVGADVTLSARHSTDPATELTMKAVPGEPGVYEASFDAEQPGVYRFEAKATLDSEDLGTAQMAVRRADGVTEHFGIRQNRPLLERLAAATGGRYFTADQAASIPEAIRYSEAGLVDRHILDLWNMPFNFLLLLLLKGGEWLLRLRWGRL